MDKEKIINACGLSCPQPAMLARKAMQEMERGELQVIVDNITARENVSRMAKYLGWEINIEEQIENNFIIVIKK